MEHLLDGKQWEKVLQLFDKLRSEEHQVISAEWQVGGAFNNISTPCWNNALIALSLAPGGQAIRAVELLNEAIQAEIPLSIEAYESAMLACLKDDDWEGVCHVMDRVVEDTGNLFEGGTFIDDSKELLPKISPIMVATLMRAANSQLKFDVSLYYLCMIVELEKRDVIQFFTFDHDVTTKSEPRKDPQMQKSSLVERLAASPLISFCSDVLAETMKSFFNIGGVNQAKDLYNLSADPNDQTLKDLYTEVTRQPPPSEEVVGRTQLLEEVLIEINSFLESTEKSNYVMPKDVVDVMKKCLVVGCPEVGIRVSARIGRTGKCDTNIGFASFLSPPSAREENGMVEGKYGVLNDKFLSSVDNIMATTMMSLRALGQANLAVQMFRNKREKGAAKKSFRILSFDSSNDIVSSWILSTHECLRAKFETGDFEGAFDLYSQIEKTSRTKLTYSIVAQGLFHHGRYSQVKEVWMNANEAGLLSEKVCILTLESCCKTFTEDSDENKEEIKFHEKEEEIHPLRPKAQDISFFAKVANALERTQGLRRGEWIAHNFDLVQRVVLPSRILEFLWRGNSYRDWELSFWRQGIKESLSRGEVPNLAAFIRLVQVAGFNQRYYPCRGSPKPDVKNETNNKFSKEKLRHQIIDRADGVQVILETIEKAKECDSNIVCDPEFTLEAVRGLRALKADREVLEFVDYLTDQKGEQVSPDTLANALNCAIALNDARRKEDLISRIASSGYDYRNLI